MKEMKDKIVVSKTSTLKFFMDIIWTDGNFDVSMKMSPWYDDGSCLVISVYTRNHGII